MAAARGVFEDCARAEAGVLPTRGPRQKSKWLEAPIALDDVNPIPHLQATDEGQELVGCEIERVQDQTKLGVLDERKKTVRAVADPLNEHGLTRASDLALDERQPSRFTLHALRAGQRSRHPARGT